MCRWAAHIGARAFLSDLVSAPSHSLIAQSREAAECKTALNGDGFGIAWYDARPEPGLYRDISPAWSDPNLRSLAQQVQARIALAHVRASTGSATSRNNCHPFVVGRWSFMHNGQVGGFERLRKRADMAIAEDLYGYRKGASDSEALFLIALGMGLQNAPRHALAQAAAQLQRASEGLGCTPALRLTAAMSDGEKLFAVRYASDAFAPSLYYRRAAGGQGWQVTSEPLDTAPGWTCVPAGSFCTFTETEVQIEAFTIAASEPQLLVD